MTRGIVTSTGYFVLACDTAAVTTVAAVTSSVQLLAVNMDRVHGSVFNNSTATLYLLWGTGTASSSNFTVKIPPSGFYELPRVSPFVGPLQGAWSAANGSAMITEAT